VPCGHSGRAAPASRGAALRCAPVRVVDLDRDMRDVIPSALSPDSTFLFARMTARTLALARAAPGCRVLDVASGLGQDARALAAQGALAIAAEPSARMSALAATLAHELAGAPAQTVRAWADRLPFASGRFDAVICKGALDHFDAPSRAIAEMARVTRRDGRVVLAIANFDSLACRVARGLDAFKQIGMQRQPARGRRHYDVPHDHFTRYDLGLMRAQASEALVLEHVEGVSLGWGMPGWSRAIARLPARGGRALLRTLDAAARQLPALADVVLLVGRPRASSIAST
jgi:SAM-dependent methyltransferase